MENNASRSHSSWFVPEVGKGDFLLSCELAERKPAMRNTIVPLSLALVVLVPAPVRASDTIAYTYDARGRLTKVTHAGSMNNGVVITYAFDKAGNRLTKVTSEGGPNVPSASGQGLVVPIIGGALVPIPSSS